MAELQLTLESSEVGRALDVRGASIRDRISRPFEIRVWAMSRNHEIDLDAVVGHPASLRYDAAVANAAHRGARFFHGTCLHAEQTGAEVDGLSSYVLYLGPRLALLDARRNYRIFQHQPVTGIARALLDEWNVAHEMRVDQGRYPELEIRVQYGESDLAFLERLLACHGVAYYFEHDEQGTRVVLDDQPHARDARTPALPFVDNPNQASGEEHIRSVRLRRQVRPGRYRIRAHDFRRPPSYELAAEASGDGDEARLERYHYLPGSFFTAGHPGGGTPAADDRGAVRGDPDQGQELARVALERQQSDRRVVDFVTNAFDLTAGASFTVARHPRGDLTDRKLLLREVRIDLSTDGESSASGIGLFADQPFRPPIPRPPPRADGIESAMVVGPAGEEIHTDEFGRVRVQFHWDREGRRDERSSCWVRVSQGWAGAGFGMMALPRVGQEVVIGFLGGDPDQPVVIGRLYNSVNPVPHALPEGKAISTWKSCSTPNGEGFNELRFDDRTGSELVYVRAERDLQKLVRRNERERTLNDRTIVVGGDLREQVRGDEHHVTEGEARRTVAGEHHVVTRDVKRELVESDAHLRVTGEQREHTLGKRSVIVDGALHVRVGGKLVAESAGTHVKAPVVVLEAEQGITLKVGGAFISISADEVAITAPMVRLNSGGSHDTASSCEPADAEEAKPAEGGEDE